MTERPILFSGAMVRAIMRPVRPKTQTRRPIKGLLGRGSITEFGPSDTPGYDWHFRDSEMRWHDVSNERLLEMCPHGVPGDRLWVREAWTSGYQNGCWGTIFRADSAYVQGARTHPKGPHFHATEIGPHVRWKPSVHMPRWASRLTLEVEHVRVQRIQEISDADALAEGCTPAPTTVEDVQGCDGVFDQLVGGTFTSKFEFMRLWHSTHGSDAWERKDWAWAVTFRRVEAA